MHRSSKQLKVENSTVQMSNTIWYHGLRGRFVDAKLAPSDKFGISKFDIMVGDALTLKTIYKVSTF